MSSYEPDDTTPPRPDHAVDETVQGSIEETDHIITPARIGEFISFEQCPRYFKHAVDDIDETIHHDDSAFGEAFQPLNLLLSKAGDEFETVVCEQLEDLGATVEDLETDDDSFAADDSAIQRALIDAAESSPAPEAPTVLYQAGLIGYIGDWRVAGEADLIFIWSVDGGVKVRVVDIKSASEEKSYHQIQAATYADLLQHLIDGNAVLDADTISVDGGIITRDNNLTSVHHELLPQFETKSRIMDVRRLLAADGKFNELTETPLETVPYQLNDKCANCAYNEGCLTDAYEDGHLRLLGLSPAQQERLKENFGIETVYDLADLARPPDVDDWYPNQYKQVSFAKDPYDELRTIPGIGEQLPTLLYRARVYADYLDTDGGEYSDRPVPWIPGTGRCPLPMDDPPEGVEHDWQHGSLVRIYLNVQVDYLRDQIMQLSARVSATGSDADSQRLSVLADGAPNEETAANSNERQLLEEFIEELYGVIRTVADGIEFRATDQEHPPLHFYVYTGREQSALEDAFDRHDTPHINSMQSLVEGQPGFDQPMVSRLRPVVQTHTGVPTPSAGLLPAYDHLANYRDDVYSKPKTVDAWSYEPEGHPDVDSLHLRPIFDYRLFNYAVDGDREDSTGVAVDPESSTFVDGIPTRVRYGAGVPLGYLWSAVGRIDPDWASDLTEDNPLAQWELLQYHYHNPDSKGRELTPEDIEALGRHLCDALEHVERALNSGDAALNKEPYPLNDLATDGFSPPSLAAASHAYTWIEHTATRRSEYDHYRRFPEQRMLAGKTIPVTITDVEKETSSRLRVEGRMMFEQAFDAGGETVRRACRESGSDGTSSGSWMVANPYDYGSHTNKNLAPYQLEAGVKVTLDEMDMESRDIVFYARNYYNSDGDFTHRHKNWAIDEQFVTDDNNQMLFESGKQVILDPQTDDIIAERIQQALEHANTNHLHDSLEAVRHGADTQPTTGRLNAAGIDNFVDWLKDEHEPPSLPSDEQRTIITETDAQLVGLQGPPGTGKTAGALAPAIAARVYGAAAANDAFAGLITAPSNTAIDELLEDVAPLVAAAGDTDSLADSLDDVHLVRVADKRPADAPANVTYIDYNDDDDADKLAELGEWVTTGEKAASNTGSGGQAELGEFNGGNSKSERGPQVLVFATPGRAWRLVKEFSPNSDPADVADQEYWDLLVADEASMLTVPKLLLASTALTPDGQVLIGGDHRQLPPVQSHDWEREPRRDIRATVPYLSALNYLRLLRGEDVLDEERLADWVHDRDPAEAAEGIPFIRLSTTYRFGSETANLVEEAVYAADDISYDADEDADPSDITLDDGMQAPVETALTEAPITLITYDDETSQQSNPIETALAAQLVKATDESVTTGVVTLHNAQRSQVKAHLEEDTDTPAEKDLTTVETVNRFQGGEQDLMVVSATVSDPQYISVESDFLLNENRINVSFTRHCDKLVVLAPRSLLGYIPEDADLYDNTLLWKLLSERVGEAPQHQGQEIAWRGSLGEFLNSDPDSSEDTHATLDESAHLSVYHICETGWL